MKRVPIARLARLTRNKFGARAREYAGREYHSQKEARYAAELDLRAKAIGVDRIASWRPQVSVKLEVNGKLICRYIVDFLVTHADGHEEWIEVKGFETPEWKLKDKLFRAIFPDRKLTIVR
jgi:hypothetical protein